MIRASEAHEAACLVTMVPKSTGSWLFHYPNTRLARLQAEAMELPLVEAECPDDERGGLEALKAALKRAKEEYGVEGVVTGAVKSSYQAARFAAVCRELGLECINPLWGTNEVELLREVVGRGVEAIITRVAGYPLSKSLLGRRIDWELVELLAHLGRYINPSGEGGEYETFVLDSPLFKKRILPLRWRVEGVDYDATLVIEEAILVDKSVALTSSGACLPSTSSPAPCSDS